MKVLKHILIGFVCIPFVLIAVFVLFEIMGMAVNHVSSSRQTKNIVRIIEEELSSAEIVDCYTETGNTSGTGNHVDMLSVVIFKTEDQLTDIEDKLGQYYELDEWSFWIEGIKDIETVRREHNYLYPYLDNMSIPEHTENGYLLYLNMSAPFPDNIEGH